MTQMNRTVKYALSVAMTAMIIVPAFAQDSTPFPDSKEGHWAYDALNRMKKEGVLVGYPDGTYKGARLASRYEMAVAINAAYMNLSNKIDGVGKQLDELKAKVDGMQPGVSQADFDALKSAVNDLTNQVNGMKSYAQDIADLRRMADKFEKDLAAIGVDVDDMKKHLGDLDRRVKHLEDNQLPFVVHGDINTLGIAGYSQSHGFGVTVDGRPTGYGRGSQAGLAVGADQDFTMLHEVALQIKSRPDMAGPKFEATAVIGNMLGDRGSVHGVGGGVQGAPFGSQSTIMPGTPFNEGTESVYFQTANVSMDQKTDGLPFSFTMGRFGLQLGSYILKRYDSAPYYDNDRWENGDYDVDGLHIKFHVGGFHLGVFAARTSDQVDTNGTPIQPMLAGNSTNTTNPFARSINPISGGSNGNFATIDQILGAHAWIPVGSMGSLNLAYVILASNNTFTADPNYGTQGNRMADWGVDTNLKFGSIHVKAGYSRTDVYMNDHTRLTKYDGRATASASYRASKWGLNVGYKYIEPFFGAPGDWGRIGAWWNPTDIEGVDANAHVKLTDAFSLHGGFEYYTGIGRFINLSKDDKITRITADLGWKFGSGYNASLGFEDVEWNLKGFGGKPQEQWFNVGVGYDVNKNSEFSVMWQISNYDGKNQPGFNNFFGQNTAKGGLITTQFSVKF